MTRWLSFQGHLIMSGDIFYCHDWGGCHWHPVGKDQGCCLILIQCTGPTTPTRAYLDQNMERCGSWQTLTHPNVWLTVCIQFMLSKRGEGRARRGTLLYKGGEFIAAAFCDTDQAIMTCWPQVYSLIPATSCLSTWTTGRRWQDKKYRPGGPCKSS